MRVDKVAKLPEKDRRELIQETASQRGMTSAVVEKDFWVCWVLNRLFSSPLREKLLFKGGTSLSKVFNLIERFSEDIDLVLDIREVGRDLDLGLEVSRRRRDDAAAEIHQLSTDYLQSTLVPELRELLGDTCEVLDVLPAGGDAGNHPKEIRVRYPATFSSKYLRPEVLLEVSPLALWLPQGDFEITPYAAASFPAVFTQPQCPVRAIVAERSFWEKATIVHVLAYWPDSKPVPPRHSRHLYDLAQMARAPVCAAALARLDLLRTVADFKATYYAQATARYDLARSPKTLRLVPEDRVLAELARDHRGMREMFYGSPPTFDAIVTTLRELEAEINTLPEPYEAPEAEQ
jgi:hypothetical protein